MGTSTKEIMIPYARYRSGRENLPSPSLAYLLGCPGGNIDEKNPIHSEGKWKIRFPLIILTSENYYSDWIALRFFAGMTLRTDDLDFVHKPPAPGYVVNKIQERLTEKKKLSSKISSLQLIP